MKKITKLKKMINAIRDLNKNGLVEVITPTEYNTPAISLLDDYFPDGGGALLTPIELESKIAEFGFESAVENIRTGPVITRYEIKLARGVRISQIRNVSEDLALALMSDRIRIQAPIPGTNLVGIEIANTKQAIIGLKSVLQNYGGASFKEIGGMDELKFQMQDAFSDHRLPIALGTDIVGKPKVIDLAKMPHLLIAGQTGSGKSVCLNSIVLSILFTRSPDECKLILVDPKRVEMSAYKHLPHLERPVVTEPAEAMSVFASLIKEMENRYRILSEAQVRNIESYNKDRDKKMPYIVTIVDEMADLMMTSGKELEKMIVRLAQLARAVGIHLVLATQKPVVKVVTGLIKSNMPSRISFQVASKMDSRVILDVNGAEKLIGRGDMLLMAPGSPEPERFHGAWVSDEEIRAVTDYIKGV